MNAAATLLDFTAPLGWLWILDPDEALCRILTAHLRALGWQVRRFANPADLEAALVQARPDLLLLEQQLPERSGLEVVRALRQRGHRFGVLMLAAQADPRARVDSLESGADDVLTKPFLLRELVLRLEHLLAHSERRDVSRQKPPPGCFRLGTLRFDPANRLLQSADGQRYGLSQGDALLLLAFCQSGGAVLSRQELADRCGSHPRARHSRSIDVRLSKLRQLLGRLGNGAAWITSVRGRGYRLAIAARPDRRPLVRSARPPGSPWPQSQPMHDARPPHPAELGGAC